MQFQIFGWLTGYEISLIIPCPSNSDRYIVFFSFSVMQNEISMIKQYTQYTPF